MVTDRAEESIRLRRDNASRDHLGVGGANLKEVSSAGEKIDDLAAALIARVDDDRLAVVARLRHFEAQRRRMRRAICTRAAGRQGGREECCGVIVKKNEK